MQPLIRLPGTWGAAASDMPDDSDALPAYNAMQEDVADPRDDPPVANGDGLDGMDVSSEVMPPIDIDKQLVLNFKAVSGEVPAGPGVKPIIPAWLKPRKQGAVAQPDVRKVGA